MRPSTSKRVLEIGVAICIVGVAATWLFATNAAMVGDDVAIKGGSPWGIDVIKELAREYAAGESSAATLDINRWDDRKNIERFCAGECDVLVDRAFATAEKRSLLEKQFPTGTPQPEVFVAGYAKVAVVTHPANAVSRVALTQLRALLSKIGKGMQWPMFGGSGGEVKCYGEGRDATSRLVIRHACMMLGPRYPTGYHLYRDDLEQCRDAEEVLKKVRADGNGIGFVLYDGKPLNGVKILAVGKTDKGPFVKPKLGAYIQEGYPLSEPLILYLHPKAPPLARKFCEFCISEEGAKIAAKHGLIAPWHQRQAEAAARLREMKAGKGVRIPSSGTAGGRKVMQDLAAEYVKAKAVVRMQYSTATEASAVGYFVNGRELLVTERKVTAAHPAMRVHKEKWDALKPAEHVLAGRGVAIVVNSANKVGALTLEQVRAVFGGKVKDWSILGVAAGQIHRYGPFLADPASKLFHKKVLPSMRCGGLRRRKDAAAVVNAVATDPDAIAFINTLNWPRNNKAIRVVRIRTGKAAIPPVPQAILSGRYPISERLWLYVSPKASPTAKDFVKFILFGGGVCDKIYRTHGLIPPPRPGAKKPAPRPAPKRAKGPAKGPGKKPGRKPPKGGRKKPAKKTAGRP